MPTAEKINTAPQETYEQEARPASDTLRHSLLSASDGEGGYVMIPRDTVVVEMNSNAINEESFQNLSGIVEDIKEEPTFSSSTNLQKRGYGKLGMGNYMSSIDRTARRELKKTETSPNLTFLYDGSNVDMDGKTFIPSAILVHEDMSEQQIHELREKLPAGVPLIDGKTNRLLDEVGQAEREEGQRFSRIVFGFGHFALEDIVETSASTPRQRRSRASRSFDWDAAERQFDDDPDDTATKTVPQVTPESSEVQAHAKAQEIIAEKTGGREWGELDAGEQRSVRRQVVRETHPDFEGGDVGVFRAAQDSMNLKSREKEE
jgi:hypothetical protein